MISADIRAALRRIRKNAGHALLNVVGLALGLVCCAFIGVFIADELAWESVHERADRIVRFGEDHENQGTVARVATTYGPLGPAVLEDLPMVEEAVRVLPYPMLFTRHDGVSIQEDDVLMVDSTFFSVFDFDFLAGDAGGALDRPFSLVLTRAAALRYFGTEQVLGETLVGVDDEDAHTFTITGVLNDLPRQTHLQFEMLGSWSSARMMYGGWIEDPRNWDHPPVYTYGVLASADKRALDAALPAFAEARMGPQRTQTRALKAEYLQDLRLRSGRQDMLGESGSITTVYLFGVIALLILLVACVNFTNLATARAAARATEVGTRKALGAGRLQLIRQFWIESMLMSGLAAIVVLVTFEALLPAFNLISGKDIQSGYLLDWRTPVVFLAVVLAVGTAAGSYPALFLSRLLPARAFRGGTRPGAVPLTRRVLVVFQFVVSIGLIVGTAVVQRQLDYAQSERLGFDKERVVLVPLREMANQFEAHTLLERWRRSPVVEAATASSGMPGLGQGIYDWLVQPRGSHLDSLTMRVLTVEEDYVRTFGMEIVAGRDFSREFPGDATGSYLINESAAQRMGWTPEEAVGKEMVLSFWFEGENRKEGAIVGVVRDFQYRSLRHAIEPIVFHILPNSYYYDFASARLAPGDPRAGLAALEAQWREFNPGRPFEYRFLDEQFDALYQSEERLARLLGLFALVAIGVACLGLFGLAALAAEQRTKEIGIRKVLGASVAGMVALLSRDLLLLVGIAFLLAVPAAWAVLGWWMAGFTETAGMPWWTLALAALVSFGAAWAAVGIQAVRAASANPVTSLRYE